MGVYDGNCKFCGNYYKNVHNHQRYACNQNPNKKIRNRTLKDKIRYHGNCNYCGKYYKQVIVHETYHCALNPNKKDGSFRNDGECKYCHVYFKQCRNHEKECYHNHKRVKRDRSGVCKYCHDFFDDLHTHRAYLCELNPKRKDKSKIGNCQYCNKHFKDKYKHEQNHCSKNPNLDKNYKISTHEKFALDYIKSLGVDFEHQKYVPIEDHHSGYYPDFVIGDQIIEIDGQHWHNEEYDTKRDSKLESLRVYGS